jgi:hypothetical protein
MFGAPKRASRGLWRFFNRFALIRLRVQMKANAMIMSPDTAQTTDMAMIAPFESGLCGVGGWGGDVIGEVIVTASFVNRVLFTPIRTPAGGCCWQPAWSATRTAIFVRLV